MAVATMGLVTDARKKTLSGATRRSAGPGTAWMAMVPLASETPITAHGRAPEATIDSVSAIASRRSTPVCAGGGGVGTEAATISSDDDRRVTRTDLIARTGALIDEGERLLREPTLAGLQGWLRASDALLAQAWGSMDRYHLSWLMVGRPANAVRGRPMTGEEEAAYVRDVAEQKTAALRMSQTAAEQGMPFVGETPER
jgi:hypothetical protein